MEFAQNVRCGRCGGANDVYTRFVACGARSYWTYQRLGPMGKWCNDDIEVWRINLCHPCFETAADDYLRAKQAHAKKRMVPFVIFALIGLPFFIISTGKALNFIEVVLGLIWFASVIYGGVYISEYFDAKRALHRSQKASLGSDPISDMRIAFEGEVRRLLNAPPTKEYPRPMHKRQENMFLDDKEINVVGVSESMDELMTTLDADWINLLNSKREDEATLSLIVAARRLNYSRVVSLLLDGNDPNECDEKGDAPLHAVLLGASESLGYAENDVLSLVRVLAENGARTDTKSRIGWTPLHAAAYLGYQSVGEYLLNDAAEVNARTEDGITPLMMAVGANEIPMVKFLLGHGAEINATTLDGKTALTLARSRNLPMVEGILRRGAKKRH